MNELIKVKINEQGSQVVSARDLHAFLENSDNVNTWFKRQSERAMLEEGLDFIAILQQSNGGRPNQDYAINLSAAKEISMLNGGIKGKQARQYFIECEKKLTQQFQIPSSFADALRLAADTQEKLEIAEKSIKENKPKVDFFNQVTDSKDAISIGDAAKVLNMGIGRNNLFELLRDEKVLMQNNAPYQNKIDAGYFRVIEQKFNKPDGSVHISIKTVVYQKGLDYIRKIVAKHQSK